MRFLEVPNNNPRRYLVKLRSEPIVADLSFRFVGKVCDDADAINEVSTETAKRADYLRAYHSTKYFCNPAWNSLAPVSWDISNWIRRAIWLLPEGANESVFVAALPNYYKEAAIQKRNFTALERTAFCKIVNRHLNEKEKNMSYRTSILTLLLLCEPAGRLTSRRTR